MSKRNKVLLGGGGVVLLVLLVIVSTSAKRDKGTEVRFETVKEVLDQVRQLQRREDERAGEEELELPSRARKLPRFLQLLVVWRRLLWCGHRALVGSLPIQLLAVAAI
jgi:hypothetical protein